MKIINYEEPFDLGVKRFYLPVEIQAECPCCCSEISRDLEDDYLSYPVANVKEPVTFYCEDCNEDFTENIIVKVTVEEFKED